VLDEQRRIISEARALNPAAVAAEPTLEEAYLYLSGEAAATEAAESEVSPAAP